MKPFRKRYPFLLVLTLLLLLPGGAGLWLGRSLPTYQGTLRIESPSLSAPVRIVRDAEAVPHIFAEQPDDAYFALGWVHAQERFWQMDLLRRTGQGRLAELFGTQFGEQALRNDRLMRTLGLARLAEQSFKALAAPVRTSLEAYAAGVNAWLTQSGQALPLEIRAFNYRPDPWTPADSLIWGKLMAVQLSQNYRLELLRGRLLQRLKATQVGDLYPPYPLDAPATLLDPLKETLRNPDPAHGGTDASEAAERQELVPQDVQEALAGLEPALLEHLTQALPPPLGPSSASNAWVITGSRSASGKPLLANDPHLGLQAPILWFLARIETPDLRLAGATVPGVPFHILGHNGHVAWGITNTGSDVQDLFIERLDATDPNRYLTPWGSLPFETREEVIAIAGSPSEIRQIRSTRHGPVLSDADPRAGALPPPNHVLALAFSGLTGNDTTAEALWRMNRARSVEAYGEAIRLFRTPQQNHMVADIYDRIGFFVPGQVPLRRAGDGRMPVPGWTGQYDWIGFIPHSLLPQFTDPPSEMVINANNAVAEPDYPFLLTAEWEDHYRASRLTQLLANAPPQSADTVEALQRDAVSLPARELLPLMLTVPAEGSLAEAVALLRNWDGAMDRERPEPLIFETWLKEFSRRVLADELGILYEDYMPPRPEVLSRILRKGMRWCDEITTPGEETCAEMLRESLTAALATLSARHGPALSRWRWGSEHQAALRHPLLDKVPLLRTLFALDIETDGNAHTVNRAGLFRNSEAEPFRHTQGPGYRGVYDLEDLNNSRFMIATGQSGHILSRHFRDLVQRWRDGDHLILAGHPDDLVERSRGTLVLTPASSPAGSTP